MYTVHAYDSRTLHSKVLMILGKISSAECGFTDRLETGDGIVYYFAIESTVTSFDQLEKNPNALAGFFQLKFIKTTTGLSPVVQGEIYNVCTRVSHRNKGVSKLLLSKVVQMLRDEGMNFDLWLGVLLTTPDLVKVYAASGFEPAEVTNVSPFSNRVFDFYFISMYYSLELVVNQKTKKMAYAKSKHLVSKHHGLLYELHEEKIAMDTASFLLLRDQYINSPVEYGGYIGLVDEYVSSGTPRRSGVLHAFTKRGSEERLAVNVSEYYISWHTHPKIGYVTHDTVIGPPSSNDMAYTVRSFVLGLYAHYVISKEGVYLITLTPPMMHVLAQLFAGRSVATAMKVTETDTIMIETLLLCLRTYLNHVMNRVVYGDSRAAMTKRLKGRSVADVIDDDKYPDIHGIPNFIAHVVEKYNQLTLTDMFAYMDQIAKDVPSAHYDQLKSICTMYPWPKGDTRFINIHYAPWKALESNKMVSNTLKYIPSPLLGYKGIPVANGPDDILYDTIKAV